MLRPNAATLEALKSLKANTSSVARILGSDQPSFPSSHVSLHHTGIFDRGSMIGVYIRTGDKAIEMKLPPIATYESAADQIWQRLSAEDNSSTKAALFLGSEDPEVFRSAVDWTKRSHGWEIFYTTLYPRDNLTAAADATVKEQQKLTLHTRHHELEYISMLLNLELLLSCDAWVCTLASNVCRLIDELR